jgi:hypothetical protein
MEFGPYRHEKKNTSHVKIGRKGRKNWLVIGIIRAIPSNSAAKNFRSAGRGPMTMEKTRKKNTRRYCRSYNVHLCFLSARSVSKGENEVLMADIDDAGDTLE